jgi:hypothetical protein
MLSTRRGTVAPACDHRPSQRGLGPAPFVASTTRIRPYAFDENCSVRTHFTRSLNGFSLCWEHFDGFFASTPCHRIVSLRAPLNEHRSERSAPRLAEAELLSKFFQAGDRGRDLYRASHIESSLQRPGVQTIQNVELAGPRGRWAHANETAGGFGSGVSFCLKKTLIPGLGRLLCRTSCGLT